MTSVQAKKSTFYIDNKKKRILYDHFIYLCESVNKKMDYSTAKILAKSRKEIRGKKLSYRTERAYLDWIYRFLLFHPGKDPGLISELEISIFLSYHAVRKQVAPSTQNQAFHAIRFMYRYVFNRTLKRFHYIRTRGPLPPPVVFSKDEIREILGKLSGDSKLIVSLLYGCGLRLSECLSLRIKDIDMINDEISVLSDPPRTKRKLVIPKQLRNALFEKIEILKYQYFQLSINKFPGVTIPEEIKKSQPNAAKSFEWFYFFPSMVTMKTRLDKGSFMHHRSDTYVQRAVRKAIQKAGINKQGTCSSFRHSFALHLLEEGYDISQVQKIMGHKNIKSTKIYRKIIDDQKIIISSPLDRL
jgi:integron integrase